MGLVTERPIFRSAEYLRDLIRRNKPNAGQAVAVQSDEPQPFMPQSAFVLGDEIIECETVAE